MAPVFFGAGGRGGRGGGGLCRKVLLGLRHTSGITDLVQWLSRTGQMSSTLNYFAFFTTLPILYPREYWMIYRGPGFFAVVLSWLYAPPPLPPSVSSTGDTQEDWERETSCWRERNSEYGGRELTASAIDAWYSVNHSIFSALLSLYFIFRLLILRFPIFLCFFPRYLGASMNIEQVCLSRPNIHVTKKLVRHGVGSKRSSLDWKCSAGGAKTLLAYTSSFKILKGESSRKKYFFGYSIKLY